VAKPKVNSSIDLQEDVAQPVGDLKKITELGQKLVAKSLAVKELEEQVKIIKAEIESIEMDQLPSAMMEVGMSKFVLDNGVIISSDPYVRASIPTMSAIEKADDEFRSEMINRRESALAWLKSHNADSIIKNEVVVSFGKGEDPKAKKLVAELRNLGLKVTNEESVNFQTLNAFVRETLKKGTDIPFETFAIFSGNKATIKSK
jgi:hypothetical protein